MFKKIERGVSLFVEDLAMILLVLMVLVVCFTVFTRYFLSYTPSWGEETSLLCMIWFGFLSMALGVRDDVHLSITILDHVTPRCIKKPIALVKYVCIFGFGVFMLVYGYQLTEVGRLNNFPGLGISSAWLYAAVPVSAAAIVVYSIEKFVLILLNHDAESGAAPEATGGK